MYRFEPYKKEVDPEWNLFVATLLGFFLEKEEFKRIKGWIIVEYSIKDRFSGEDGFMESLFNLLHKFWKLIFEFFSISRIRLKYYDDSMKIKINFIKKLNQRIFFIIIKTKNISFYVD